MKIIHTKTFEKSLEKIDKEIQIRIIEKILLLSKEEENLDIKKLQPKEKGIFRLIVGKYRILFNYQEKDTIKLLDVDNRDSIYMF
ncbi:MAG: type II toxin-antitoxin system RelE/ParE family toxin [Candidatus Gracilibacteria bacterium]|nr:type II toxin-antitoxin system RelE/ParE family toxin [Candidatus Gracilibacteria bacterium]